MSIGTSVCTLLLLKLIIAQMKVHSKLIIVKRRKSLSVITIEVLHESRDSITTVTTPPSCMANNCKQKRASFSDGKILLRCWVFFSFRKGDPPFLLYYSFCDYKSGCTDRGAFPKTTRPVDNKHQAR